MSKTHDELLRLKALLNKREEQFLSPFAAMSNDGVRRFSEEFIESGHRQNYAVDSDRILHSLAYTRYIDKTQVFYLLDNDHITHRVLHVQLVSKISRTICRFLELNEDLAEAISLAHDIGHCPFGHDGESYLSELCEKVGIGNFQHNIQSVRSLEKIERKGRGWNLTLQVLDGVLCHDGEIHDMILLPERAKDFKAFDSEIMRKMSDSKISLRPMTVEGCVVRMADTISYVGRDIEDAIRVNLIKREDIPSDLTDILGNRNGRIVYRLVTDLITNSVGKSAIGFSTEVSNALKELKAFNLKKIYLNSKIKRDSGRIKQIFNVLFEQYLRDLEVGNTSSKIFSEFLDDMTDDYRNNSKSSEIVRDFIAGMTDAFFLREAPESLRPRRKSGRF